jgi:ADYC domain/Pentapeptide repeats (8 copies)
MGKPSLALAVLLAGCMTDELDLESTESEVVSTNGVSLNGVSLNGVSLNGVSLNGVSLNGVSLNGVSLNGVSLNGVSLNGTTLTGTKTTGGTLTGSSVGSTMTAALSNGASLSLRIDSAATLAAPNTDVWSYGVSYYADGGWKPLCGTDVGALAVAGTWDTRAGVVGGGAYTASTTSFTFACRAMTVAKCVELGYKPWLGRASHLQTCVRLLRGDYCGNGQPYTVTGNTVNLYDSLNIQTDSANWSKEAEWTPNGASCITTDRKTRFYNANLVPTCIADNTLTTGTACATNFAKGALMLSELPMETGSAKTATTTAR